MQKNITWNAFDAWKPYAVSDVHSVEEFCHRYYKHDRFVGRGEAYVTVVLNSHHASLADEGVTIISHHDSCTGQVVSFYGH